MYKVGDKVRLTVRQVYTRQFEVGHTATVLTNQEKGSSHISVHYDDDNVEYRMVNVNHITPVALSPQEEGIGRFNGATVDGARFEREGERVTVYVGTRKDSVSTTMTLAHFNEVHRILNEEAK